MAGHCKGAHDEAEVRRGSTDVYYGAKQPQVFGATVAFGAKQVQPARAGEGIEKVAPEEALHIRKIFARQMHVYILINRR